MTDRPADAEDALGPAMAVCLACVAGSRLDGAAFTVMASSLARETLRASDAVIAAAAELQFTVGEGPCLDAFTLGRPVLVPDLAAAWAATRWPVFAAEVGALPIGGLFAFPMQLGAITGGVCELYRREAGPLTVEELEQVLRAVDGATLALLQVRAGHSVEDFEAGWPDGHRPGRAQVYQAIGMLTVQLGVPAEEAFARLRGHAYAHGRLVGEVADAIVARRLRLSPDPR